MKKIIAIVVVLIVVLVVVMQLVLPNYVAHRIESKIKDTFHPTAATVHIDSMPAIKMLWGSLDSVEADLQGLTLKNGLTIDVAKFDLKNVSFNTWDLYKDDNFNPKSIGYGTIDSRISQESLSNYLKGKVKGLDDIRVVIDSNRMQLDGHFSIGAILEGEAMTGGTLELKNNTVYFSPKQIAINGMGINGINTPIMREIQIYDFKEFPVPVQAEKVETEKGSVHILLQTEASK